MRPVRIAALDPAPVVVAALRDLLVEAVTAGASVSFMHPLPLDDAEAFWTDAFASAARGQRMILGAWNGATLVGTVTLRLDCAANQPHRAVIVKMIVALSHRGRGIGSALMRAAEAAALAAGRSLLVLDTASDGGASGLYERLGFRFAGEIPDYAFKPHGGLSGARFYYKQLEGR
jgi:ribosomal protein S18 acetylase RimI-like enzyme